MQEINANFNTWDIAGTFDRASPRYQLDVVVARFADRLSIQPGNDPSVAEFAQRVNRARQLSGGSGE